MYRLSIIISEIYHKYLPLAEKAEIQLNLDIPDTSLNVDDPEIIRTELEESLNNAMKRTPRGEIKISVQGKKIIVSDSGTTLSPAACSLLSRGRISAKSKVGFGTTVEIDLTKPKEN